MKPNPSKEEPSSSRNDEAIPIDTVASREKSENNLTSKSSQQSQDLFQAFSASAKGIPGSTKNDLLHALETIESQVEKTVGNVGSQPRGTLIRDVLSQASKKLEDSGVPRVAYTFALLKICDDAFEKTMVSTDVLTSSLVAVWKGPTHYGGPAPFSPAKRDPGPSQSLRGRCS